MSSQEPKPEAAADPDAPLPLPAKRKREKPGIFRLVSFVVTPLMCLMVKYHFIDAEKMPASGPFVLAPNHFSNIDPVVVGYGVWKLGRNPRFLAKASILRVPVIGWILRKTGQIPVERGSAARGQESLSAASQLLATGGGVIVYPEGSLTRDPELWPMRGKTGAVRLALEAGIPLVPAVHWGTQELMGRYTKKFRPFPRKHITMRIGDPVDLSAYRGRGMDGALLTAATAEVMEAITALLAEVRQETPPAKRWDPSEHNQNETGSFQ